MRGKKIMNGTKFSVERQKRRWLRRATDGAVNRLACRALKRDNRHGHDGGAPQFLIRNMCE